MQAWSDRAREPVYPPHVGIYHFPSSVQSHGGHHDSVSSRALFLVGIFSRSSWLDSVGNLLGEKRAERAEVATRAALVLALLTNAFTRCGMFGFFFSACALGLTRFTY